MEAGTGDRSNEQQATLRHRTFSGPSNITMDRENGSGRTDRPGSDADPIARCLENCCAHFARNYQDMQKKQEAQRKEVAENPIFQAIESNSLGKIESMIDEASIEQTLSFNGFTPLLFAVSLGNLGIARKLLEGGANIKAQGKGGLTALHIAVASSRLDIVELLIRNGADLDMQDSTGSTPLHIAISKNFVKIAQALTDAGANNAIVDSKGRKPEQRKLIKQN